MNLLALQEVADAYDRADEPHWMDFVFWVAILLIAVPLLFWILRRLTHAMSATQQAIDLTKEAVEVQRETNRLLAELNESLKNRS